MLQREFDLGSTRRRDSSREPEANRTRAAPTGSRDHRLPHVARWSPSVGGRHQAVSAMAPAKLFSEALEPEPRSGSTCSRPATTHPLPWPGKWLPLARPGPSPAAAPRLLAGQPQFHPRGPYLGGGSHRRTALAGAHRRFGGRPRRYRRRRDLSSIEPSCRMRRR